MASQGRLYYVMGASGSGKDSIMDYARSHIDTPVIFAHRYITRPLSAGGENHIALSLPEFQSRLHAGCFSMHWQGNGLHYGIGIELNQWLAMGLTVVVNGSRAYVEQALALYPQMVPVLISVSNDKLKQRLLARGREAPEDIELRLQRANEYAAFTHPSLVVIDNDGELAESGNAFIEYLTKL